MKQKLPIVLSVTALVVAVLGITSVAGAHGVFHALFAHNAGKVDGYNANALVRVAAQHISADVDNWDGTTITDTRTIRAPKKGFLLITYSFDADQDANETGTGIGYVSLDATRNGSPLGSTVWQAYDFQGDPGVVCCQSRAVTFQRIVAVSAGTHTIRVAANGPGGTQLVYIYDRSLSVLFVPFNGFGAHPRVIPATRAEPSGSRTQPQQ